ncbi:MAG: glutamyl-tRNA reductase [Chlamydiota bacterium]
MRVGVVGVNFKSSDLMLREVLSKAFKHCFGNGSSFPSVLLSTCNRSELYFSCDELAFAHSEILTILRKEIDVPFEHVLYSYFGGECFTHLAAVTSGLDSAIIAETAIQAQVKQAYAYASLHDSLQSALHFMFQKCLKIGKGMRTSMTLSRGRKNLQGSLERSLFQISLLLVKEFKTASILFVGNSEINRKIIDLFKSRGISNITLCTRTPKNAEDLNMHVTDWRELAEWQNYEIVICGTNQGEYLISALGEEKKGRTRIIFDLGMPRNVDPQLGRHPGIILFNIEELSSMVNCARRLPYAEIQKIEHKIRAEVDRQLLIFYKKQQRVYQKCGVL